MKRDWTGVALLVAEMAIVVVGLFGVWQIFWPASLILGSILGVFALERAQAQRDARRRLKLVKPRERVA
jgi:hypothetical protein